MQVNTQRWAAPRAKRTPRCIKPPCKARREKSSAWQASNDRALLEPLSSKNLQKRKPILQKQSNKRPMQRVVKNLMEIRRSSSWLMSLPRPSITIPSKLAQAHLSLKTRQQSYSQPALRTPQQRCSKKATKLTTSTASRSMGRKTFLQLTLKIQCKTCLRNWMAKPK